MNKIIIFFNNLIKNSYNIFEDFLRFIVENKLTSLLLVGIIGLAISGLISSIKINIIDYYLNKLFRTTNNNLINLFTSFAQFIIIIIFIYFLYNNFLKKIDYKYVVTSFNEIDWKNNLLNEIRNINSKM